MKFMAIDYGTKRVGVASTDETGHFALPRIVFENNNDLLDKIIKFKEDNNIDKIIIGESKNLDGTLNSVQEEIEKFKKMLLERGMETIYHPEVLTTREARQIQGGNDMTDASAAALILKSFIDSVYNKDA